MIITSRQQAAISSLEAGIARLGYRGNLVKRDYSCRDWFSSKDVTITANLAAFGQTPVSYSTACIGVGPANGLNGVELIRGFRSLGAPIFFEVCDDSVVPWRVGPKPTLADRQQPIRHDQIGTFLSANATAWSPAAIMRAKNIQPVSPRQLDFIDLGLLPALEEHIRLKLDPILQKGLAKATNEYRASTSRKPDEAELFKCAFWLLAGKVFHDREHGDFANLGPGADPDEVLRHVGNHYGEAISPRLLNKPSRLALQNAIWESLDFRNLSVEVLADIWSNTLVTPDVRKRLGIHSTPRSVVKYLVDHIPWAQIPEHERYVVEPCCGSARFLIAALQRLRAELPPAWEPRTRHVYFTKMLSGYEVDPFGIEISRLGLMLADYPNPNGWALHPDNVFSSPAFNADLARARVVLCNPPFEDLDEASRISYSTPTSRLPAALLLNILKHLHPDGVLGFVLPRKFLDGRGGYRQVRELLVRRFAEIELLSLPDSAFTHAQADTTILLALRPRRQGSSANVVHRKVDEGQWVLFHNTYHSTRQDEATVNAATAAKSIAVPDLPDIWTRLGQLPHLGYMAEVHRGIEWRKPISTSTEEGKRNRMDLVRETNGHGFHLGVPPGAELKLYSTPVLQHLSMRPVDQRGQAFEYAWDRPKVIVNANRHSRGRWRQAAFVDRKGELVCYQTFIAIWPQKESDLDLIAAVVNSPLGSAFVSAHEHGRHNSNETFEAIPLPMLSPGEETTISEYINAYQSAIA